MNETDATGTDAIDCTAIMVASGTKYKASPRKRIISAFFKNQVSNQYHTTRVQWRIRVVLNIAPIRNVQVDCQICTVHEHRARQLATARPKTTPFKVVKLYCGVDNAPLPPLLANDAGHGQNLK